MLGHKLIKLGSLAICLVTFLGSPAEAQEGPSTDPTEPISTPPLLIVPMPASAPPASAAPASAPPAGTPVGSTPVGSTPLANTPPRSAAPDGTPLGQTAPDAPGSIEPNNVDVGADDEGEEVSLPGDPFGDTASAGLISIRTLFQARYVSTFSESSHSERASYRVREENLDQQNDGYEINRLFLRLGSDPSKYLGFKTVLDFAELISNDPEDVVKQAYASLRPIPQRLEFTVGIFKLPFSTLELDASSRYEFSDFGSANKLTGDIGFSGRDLGVQLIGSPLKKAKRLRLTLGVFRGHSHDEHDSPAGVVAARIESKPNKHWRLGADIVHHTQSVTYNQPFSTSNKDELPNPSDPLYPYAKTWLKGQAMSADVRYKKKSLMVRGEGQYGDRIDHDARYGAETWFAAWGLIAYRVEVTDTVRLLPAVRFEWFDADLEHKDRGVQQQLSFATTVLFWDRVRFMVEATRVHVEPNTPVLNQPKPLQVDPYLALSHTRLIAQLQLEL